MFNRGYNQAIHHVHIQGILPMFLLRSYNINKQQGDFCEIFEMNLLNPYFKINVRYNFTYQLTIITMI